MELNTKPTFLRSTAAVFAAITFEVIAPCDRRLTSRPFESPERYAARWKGETSGAVLLIVGEHAPDEEVGRLASEWCLDLDELVAAADYLYGTADDFDCYRDGKGTWVVIELGGPALTEHIASFCEAAKQRDRLKAAQPEQTFAIEYHETIEERQARRAAIRTRARRLNMADLNTVRSMHPAYQGVRFEILHYRDPRVTPSPQSDESMWLHRGTGFYDDTMYIIFSEMPSDEQLGALQSRWGLDPNLVESTAASMELPTKESKTSARIH